MDERRNPDLQDLLNPIFWAIRDWLPKSAVRDCEELAFAIAHDVLNLEHISGDLWSISLPPPPVGHFVKPSPEAPKWRLHVIDGGVEFAHATVTLGPPRSSPDAPPIAIYLDVDVDLNYEWLWRFGLIKRDPGLDDTELASGGAEDVEQAQNDSWDCAVDWLRTEGFRDEEIADAAASSSTDPPPSIGPHQS